jgi:hypothetical protein
MKDQMAQLDFTPAQKVENLQNAIHGLEAEKRRLLTIMARLSTAVVACRTDSEWLPGFNRFSVSARDLDELFRVARETADILYGTRP